MKIAHQRAELPAGPVTGIRESISEEYDEEDDYGDENEDVRPLKEDTPLSLPFRSTFPSASRSCILALRTSDSPVLSNVNFAQRQHLQ